MTQMSAGTTPQMDLNELAARVERLSGPDRRVDCAIFATVHPELFGDSAAMYARIDWTRNRADWMWLRDIGMPAYTASIDAAMTLCSRPPSFDLSHDHEIQGAKWQCLVGDADGWTPDGRASAATPALALTAAALRARSQAASQ